MPFDGNGNFTREHDWTDDADASILVRADRFDEENDDFKTAFENCLTRDSQGKPTANFSFNGFKGITLADATTERDAVNVRSLQRGTYTYIQTTGSSNAYVGSLSPSISAYTAGLTWFARANHTNDGAVTFNLNSLGAKDVKIDGQALSGGEIISGSIYLFAFNSTGDCIDLIKPQNATEALKGIVELATNAETITGTDTERATHPAGVKAALDNKVDNLFKYAVSISGLVPTNNGSDSDHDLDISTGFARFSDGTFKTATSAFTKQIDAIWASGTNQGGTASGVTFGADDTVHIFILTDDDNLTFDYGFDSDISATNLLGDAAVVAADFTKARRIGSWLLDGSANLIQYAVYESGGTGLVFQPNAVTTDLQASSMPTSKTAFALSVPNGIRVMANVSVFFNWDAGSARSAIISSDTETDVAANAQNGTVYVLGGTAAGTDKVEIQKITDTSQQLYYRGDGSTSGFRDFDVTLKQFEDYRKDN